MLTGTITFKTLAGYAVTEPHQIQVDHLGGLGIPRLDASALVQRLRDITGFLDGSVGPGQHGWYKPGANNATLVAGLKSALAHRYPEAGAPLWAVRIWTNLIWQPAYVSVLSVHCVGVVPDLDGLAQKADGIFVNGYSLEAPPRAGLTTEAMIARAGAALRGQANLMLDEVNATIRLKRLPALRLLADRILGLMSTLQRLRPDLGTTEIKRYSDLWLSAMGLTGQGDLETLSLRDGRKVLVIARKGCCLDYLVEPHIYCASCPKQPEDLRHTHQRAEAEASFT